MDGERLSSRAMQPGLDRAFSHSESNFVIAAEKCLDPQKYRVTPGPKDLMTVFAGIDGASDLGIRPEASIESRKTGKKFFVEVKKQAARGNAEERVFKHHTVQFYKTLHAVYGYPYHPYVTVFCAELARLPRYTQKFAYLLEEGQYFLWVDYDFGLLCAFLEQRCAAWLDIP